MTGLKNISKAEVLTLKDEVAYQKGQVVSKTLAQNAALSVTLFSFDKGEEISTHESGGDAFRDLSRWHGPHHHRRQGVCAPRGREYRHARQTSARGVWAGAIQDAARRGVLSAALDSANALCYHRFVPGKYA